jgi:transcriptional regulator with XRE-family HTH domain
MAQFIIKARVEKGLKQIDLAKQAGVDAKTIGEIERGGCIYNAGQINKIARTLGVTIPRK